MYSTLKPALQEWKTLREDKRRTQDVCLVAQFNPNRKGMKYTVIPKNKFVSFYNKTTTFRNYHEAIFPFMPCKLFVDLDGKDVKMELGESLRKIVQAEIANRLCTRYLMAPDSIPLPLILDGSRDGKYSVHIVYDIWVESPRHVAEILSPYILPDHPDFIDMSRYPTSETPIWFRMPYSVYEPKPGEEIKDVDSTAILPRIEAKYKRDKTDLLIKGCVSVGMCTPPEVLTLVFPLPVEKVIAGSRTVVLSESTAKNLNEGIHRVLDYIKLVQGINFQAYKIRAPDRFSWTCIVKPGLICPHKRTRDGDLYHSTHHMFLGFEDGSRLYQQCPGNGCSKRIYWDEDFTNLFDAMGDINKVRMKAASQLRNL